MKRMYCTGLNRRSTIPGELSVLHLLPLHVNANQTQSSNSLPM